MSTINTLCATLIPTGRVAWPIPPDVREPCESNELNLSAAQLAVTCEYGLARWAKLMTEVERRETLTNRDLDRLTALIAEHSEPATDQMQHWCYHPLGIDDQGREVLTFLDGQTVGSRKPWPRWGCMPRTPSTRWRAGSVPTTRLSPISSRHPAPSGANPRNGHQA